MAGTMKGNYNELCRLCASKTNLIIGISIFGDDGKSQDITKKISTCLPIKVHEKDVLPKVLCADCVYKLEMCFTFRQKSLETETFLLELILSDTAREKHKKLEMGIINVPGNQIEIIHQQEEILDPNGSNLLVNQGIIINHEGMVMHNTELDQIEFQPGTHEIVQDVSSEITQDIPHEIAETAIHNQHLNLHDESTIAQFVQQDMQISETRLRVQDLELMQEQRELIPEEYAVISNKTVERSHTKPYLALRNQTELMEVKEEDIKKETQVEMVSVTGNFPEPSESEITDDDFDNNVDESVIVEQKVKNDNDIIVEHFYQEEKHLILKENEIETTTTADVVDLYCNICEKPVKDKEDYMRHYTEHFIKCSLCSGVFTTQETYELHQKTTHPRRNTRASPKPENSPKSRTRLKSPSNNDVDDNFFKDEDDNSDNENDTKKNVQEEEEEPDESASKNGKRKKLEPKVCKECGKSYKTNYKLAEHMRRHTGEQPYKCTVCEKAFRSKIGLAQHAAKHTGQYDYSCPTCGKGFQCKSYLIVHQRVHSDEKPYQCSTCGQKFKTKQSLLDHKNRHLGVKPYTCEMCGRGFITKGLCKSHQKVHSGTDNRQYPCTVCNKLFVSKSYLATHVRIHTGEKPFMCEVCGKGFLTRVDLRIHSTMHTGEKSFVCEICGKAFARRDALRCHRRSHTGERPYRCNVCGQSFTQFSPMAIHKRLHTGERPYSCEVCKKTFVSRSTMMSHRKKHTP